MTENLIKVRGARVHNLKDISLNIPRDQLVVITGLSGSGKSSLAFDTIYAEGQRRYVESLSAYARQFLEKMEKPEVDSIEGLSPAISIQQRTTSRNPRSTVGTVTEIYDYLRLLFARIGRPHCPKCGLKIAPQTTQQIVDQIMEMEEGTRVQILAPLVEGKKGEHIRLFQGLRKDGFTRVQIDGHIHLLDEDIVLDKNTKHSIRVVVDRLVIHENIKRRLTDSMELTLSLSGGTAVLDILGDGEILFNQRAACTKCGISLPELTPQMFSFNNPQGACRECSGLGTKRNLDPDLIIPDPDLSLREGAVSPWAKRDSVYLQQMLDSLCQHYDVDKTTPFRDLPRKIQDVFLHGSGTEEIKFYFERENRRHFYTRPFEGIIPNLERRFREADSYHDREEIEGYMSTRPCPACGGARLSPISKAVTVGDKSIHEVTALAVDRAHEFFQNFEMSPKERGIAERLLKEIKERIGFLRSVGLDYITIDRPSSTLSGGEGQRIRLATQICSGLAGVLYVLDEPTIGLHQRDNLLLLKNLRHLKELGNTVLVVEHDAETILSSDHVIDMGPGAGIHGGQTVFQGSPQELLGDESSLTGQYLSGRRSIPVPRARRAGNGKLLIIEGAGQNNLKDIVVKIPLGTFTCMTGVSGSGKSSLVNEILHPFVAQKLHRSKVRVGQVNAVRGIHHVDKVINIDQSPIGRTPRSNPATYTGAFTHIRDLFSMLPESKVRGYKAGRFSFNVRGGAMRGLQRRRNHQDRDALSSRCLCDVRSLQRPPLQSRYPGDQVQRISYCGRSGHDGQSGVCLF